MSCSNSSLLILTVVFLAYFMVIRGHEGHHHHHSHSSHDHHGHHHGHEHEVPHHKYSQEANEPKTKPLATHVVRENLRSESAQQLWLETLGAVLIISLAPFFLLCLVPDLNKHHKLLKILLAFAAGGLLGDAFLHLIPHALDVHSVDGTHDDHSDPHGHSHHDHSRHLLVGLSILAGIFIFLCIEKLIRLFQADHCHGHQHTVPTTNHNVPEGKGNSKKGKKNNGDEGGQQKKEKKPVKANTAKKLRVSGYLNLAADFTHNFTDGLAIGSSFLVSRNVGFVTTITVLLHELPHEIGDYAILIQSGCSARKAMFLQLTTAIGAALGASLSLLVAGVGVDALMSIGPLSKHFHDLPFLSEDLITGCILPFTAGGFIYIAMTSVLPDLLSQPADWKHLGVFRRILQNVLEILALIGGVGMMASLSLLE